jgi:hypothetical protein
VDVLFSVAGVKAYVQRDLSKQRLNVRVSGQSFPGLPELLSRAIGRGRDTPPQRDTLLDLRLLGFNLGLILH